MPVEYDHEPVANPAGDNQVIQSPTSKAQTKFTIQDFYDLCPAHAVDQHADFHGLWSHRHKVVATFDKSTRLKCKIFVEHGVPRLFFKEVSLDVRVKRS